MRVYLASPQNQLQAHAVAGMPVLLSYALDAKNQAGWLAQYVPAFRRVLWDSGAFSELTGRAKVDVVEYVEHAERQRGIDAYAGLDDIAGDWRRSLRNYKHGGFPTMHEADPPGLLSDLVAISRERGKWLGIGLTPPRDGKEHIVRRILDGIPDDLHVHGWALRRYTHLARLDSVDSTNWWRDAFKIRTNPDTAHLTYGEALEIVVKRYQRWTRIIEAPSESDIPSLFAESAA